MNIQPHILVSNDDGIDSPGLHRLAAALRAVGRVSIVAPDRNWSISGHHKTLRQFLRADPYPLDIEGIEAVYACSGSPADCVTLGCEGLLASPPDLVVSGINRGPNLGQDVTYSGTVAAAFEATIFGLPAIACSIDDRSQDAQRLMAAAQVAAQVAANVWQRGLPRNSLLNVNFPGTPVADWRGVRVTYQGNREYTDRMVIGEDPSGRAFYWVDGEAPGGDWSAEDSDIWAVHHDFVSVTPLKLDMTDEAMRARLTGWELSLA
ncbi:MAG: 5'/3'-nucleotidase SurE [Anaerolineales bacterium]|nr:5'/3'-nucleotidase SurE [Anaerolineales bacterium]MCB9128605.1 5'/3'-nucleotidase SurE [Ardenticatenales bacterium]MCB9172543.1 5'/3'-nucleotidase SurE [Ardenticatenales bacterium]